MVQIAMQQHRSDIAFQELVRNLPDLLEPGAGIGEQGREPATQGGEFGQSLESVAVQSGSYGAQRPCCSGVVGHPRT